MQPDQDAAARALANIVAAVGNAAQLVADSTPEQQRIAAALTIHRPVRDWSWQTFGCTHGGAHDQLCAECKTCHPCRTRRTLTEGTDNDR